MCSPALIVANHDAQHFPVIHSAKEVRHDAVRRGCLLEGGACGAASCAFPWGKAALLSCLFTLAGW
jgi:hypothetical protein